VIVSDRENNRAQIFAIADGSCTQVGKTPSFEPFYAKNERFTKTGSGQTQGKLRIKKNAVFIFLQVIASHRCVSVCVDKSTDNIFLAEQATHSSVQMGGYLGKFDAQVRERERERERKRPTLFFPSPSFPLSFLCFMVIS
jgi:hypothetical protein